MERFLEFIKNDYNHLTAYTHELKGCRTHREADGKLADMMTDWREKLRRASKQNATPHESGHAASICQFKRELREMTQLRELLKDWFSKG